MGSVIWVTLPKTVKLVCLLGWDRCTRFPHPGFLALVPASDGGRAIQEVAWLKMEITSRPTGSLGPISLILCRSKWTG